ncbi:DUF418 domain-containing protein [Sphingomonas ginkgonis]|uniref:DUF418 domain-containing protein n=1 Tax=Sphingomonas ginkgonis TaxID=2315330 RepID=A0A3R9WPI6_9SPHN|nr:DUF418 domain-containing protein [Sphingomonas ginkgonis]RST30295.1 DUF418 domain-containing protein [Sphingomonas ginkgonis]
MADGQTLGIERIGSSERIASLDVLRGIAILFILFMNIPGMGLPSFDLHDPRWPSWTASDQRLWWVQQVFLDGTQRGMLELLFGAGILIMARKAMTADGPVEVADLHFRRNLLLCVLGLVNAFLLLWWGDILLVYGIAATFLFAFRKLDARALLGWAALFFVGLVVFSYSNYDQGVQSRAAYERVQAATAAHRPVSADDKKLAEPFGERLTSLHTLPAADKKQADKARKAVAQHNSGFAGYWSGVAGYWLQIMGFFWIIEAEIVGTMLVGMALYRLGVIQGLARTRVYVALLVGGYAFGLPLRAIPSSDFINAIPGPHWEGILYDLSRLGVVIGHVALVQLVLRARVGRTLLQPFQAAGRMPLTVYLFTSLLMMWLVFAPWGLNMYGKLGFTALMDLAAAVIIGELAAANLWLRHFASGPCEWVWKSLAYQRRMPFRKASGGTEVPPGLVPAG